MTKLVKEADEQMTKLPADYVAPKEAISYADFPAATDAPAGMQTLDVSQEPTYPFVHLDVRYAYKAGLPLHLQIITPAIPSDDPDKTFPLIMWVQGSAFRKQTVGYHLAQMTEVAKQGYVVAMVEYRWAPDNPFPAQVKDFHTATRYMLDHANTYHVDPKHYIAWGDSSGGNTVTLGVTTANDQAFNDEDVTVRSLHYQACIDFYGPTDISRMNKVPSGQNHVLPTSPEGEFMGRQNVYDVPERVQQANPITHIGGQQLPPFLIMHGDKDRTVPFEQSVLLYNALKAAHQEVAFYRIKNSDHSTDAFFTPAALNIVYDFLRQSLNAE